MAPPYVLLSAAMSLDGYIDDAHSERLLLSNEADFERVDRVRAECDAILVGAGTVRKDNPRLLVRSAVARDARVARGQSASPAKVIVSSRCALDPAARFFADDGAEKIVYTSSPVTALATVATIVDAGDPIDLVGVLADLSSRGVRRLVVEGGSHTLTGFLTTGLADELHLAVAPFFVGDSRAPRFVADGSFPWNARRPAWLVEVARLGPDTRGGMALLRYGLSDRFDRARFDHALHNQSTMDSA